MVSSNHHEVTRILRIDANGGKQDSLSREIADNLINRLEKKHPQAKVRETPPQKDGASFDFVITRNLITSSMNRNKLANNLKTGNLPRSKYT